MTFQDPRTVATQMYQSREEPEHIYLLAGKYWRIMLIIEILLFCIAIAGGAYFLVMTFFNFNGAKPVPTVHQSLSQGQLSKTVAALEMRKAYFEQLESGGSPASDPSR